MAFLPLALRLDHLLIKLAQGGAFEVQCWVICTALFMAISKYINMSKQKGEYD